MFEVYKNTSKSSVASERGKYVMVIPNTHVQNTIKIFWQFKLHWSCAYHLIIFFGCLAVWLFGCLAVWLFGYGTVADALCMVYY